MQVLKAVYYTVVVHNFDLQEKNYINFKVTTNFVKKFQAHFEKKLLYIARITAFKISKYFIERLLHNKNSIEIMGLTYIAVIVLLSF